jgi:hypothetical protein
VAESREVPRFVQKPTSQWQGILETPAGPETLRANPRVCITSSFRAICAGSDAMTAPPSAHDIRTGAGQAELGSSRRRSS